MTGHGVEPVDESALGIEDREIDVTLHSLPRHRPTLTTELLPPDVPHRRRDLHVVAMTVPRGDDEQLKLLDDRSIDQRGPPDLRCGCSAVSRQDVAVLRMDDNQNNGAAFACRPLLCVAQRVGPVESVHGQFSLAGTNFVILRQDSISLLILRRSDT